MKHYVAPELDFIKWQQDVVTASIEGVYDEQLGDDVVKPNAGFWN